ncbi:MAG: hypothetical protein WKF75_19445 [Singulisphaera sp.]
MLVCRCETPTSACRSGLTGAATTCPMRGSAAGRSVDGPADAPGRPTQVEVDPDHALLDARPDNNRWKRRSPGGSRP